MQIELESQAHSQRKLTITLSEKEGEDYHKKALLEFQKEVQIPGFRPGKAPLDLVEEKIGHGALDSRVLDLAVSEKYTEALREKKLQPLDYPKVEVISVHPISFVAVFPVYPEPKLKAGIDKLRLQKESVEVEEKEIKEVLTQLKKRLTKWEKVDRPTKMGDRVEIDFQGFDDQKMPLEGTHSKNYPLVLGSKSFIPGFEEEVVGLKTGEEKRFDITFPKDYFAEAFKGKTVSFEIKVHSVEEPIEQEMSDAFVKELTEGKHESLSTFKVEVTEQLKAQKEDEEWRRLEEEFAEKLADLVDVEIPEIMITRELDLLMDYLKKDFAKRGQSFEAYEAELTKASKNPRQELEPQAKKQILVRLGLEKLYEEKKISVSSEEVEKELDHQFASVPEEMKELVRKQYAPGSPQRKRQENILQLKKLVALFIEEGKSSEKKKPKKAKKEE